MRRKRLRTSSFDETNKSRSALGQFQPECSHGAPGDNALSIAHCTIPRLGYVYEAQYESHRGAATPLTFLSKDNGGGFAHRNCGRHAIASLSLLAIALQILVTLGSRKLIYRISCQA